MVKRPAYTRLKQWLDKPQCTGSSPVGTTKKMEITNMEQTQTSKQEAEGKIEQYFKYHYGKLKNFPVANDTVLAASVLTLSSVISDFIDRNEEDLMYILSDIIKNK